MSDSQPSFVRRILVIFAHPALEKSRINRRLVDAIRDLPGVTVHDLYEAYPDFQIRVGEEQALLEEHDVLILQHPFYWYSTPALLKEWEDIVLQHGWAYGSEATALKGKLMLNATTTGGRESAYQEDGFNAHTMRQLLAPISQSFRLCGLRVLPPFVVHGTLTMGATETQNHAAAYRELLEDLRDDRIDLDAIEDLPRINLRDEGES